MNATQSLTFSAFLIIAALSLCRADDWTTSDGKVYKNIKVVSSDATTVTILDDNGGAKVPLSSLPSELQKKFNYDPAVVQATKEAALDKSIQDGEDKIRSSIKTVKEVASDQLGYVGKPFYFQGKIDVSSYYNYGYEKAQETHYSFKFRDSNGDTANLYMVKGPEAEDLRARILRAQQPVSGLFSVMIVPARFEKGTSSLMVELTDVVFGGH